MQKSPLVLALVTCVIVANCGRRTRGRLPQRSALSNVGRLC